MPKNDDLFDLLRAQGVRKKIAKPIGKLDGNAHRGGAQGERLARQAVDDLESAAQDIRRRVLRTSRKRSEAAQKAGRTRKRNASKRRASARKGSQTKQRVRRARSGKKSAGRA